MEWRNGTYLLTDDLKLLDEDAVIGLLNNSYWASGRAEETFRKSFRNSLILSLLDGDRQVAFARVVTDYATFGWIMDVIVDPKYRGTGLGKWMMQCLIEHPLLSGINLGLATRDAHGLYEKYGFKREETMRRKVL
jgi:GNAT superfamily N-acetyltransferase